MRESNTRFGPAGFTPGMIRPSRSYTFAGAVLAGGGATCAGPVLRIGPAAGGGLAIGRGACTGDGGDGCTARGGCGAGGGGGGLTVVALRVAVGLDGDANCADASAGTSKADNRIDERFMASPRSSSAQRAPPPVCLP